MQRSKELVQTNGLDKVPQRAEQDLVIAPTQALWQACRESCRRVQWVSEQKVTNSEHLGSRDVAGIVVQ